MGRLMRDRKQRAAKQGVKVLVLGDDGVGKSSLICTLISNHFSEQSAMPDVYTDVAIPSNAFWDNKVRRAACGLCVLLLCLRLLLRPCRKRSYSVLPSPHPLAPTPEQVQVTIMDSSQHSSVEELTSKVGCSDSSRSLAPYGGRPPRGAQSAPPAALAALRPQRTQRAVFCPVSVTTLLSLSLSSCCAHFRFSGLRCRQVLDADAVVLVYDVNR